MAARTPAQAKLNQVVQIIGEAIESEVCSIYLLRDGVLELFATRGLAQEAVHVTRLAMGEGLVGTIAQDIEILNLDEAAAHPAFAYRPETGEEQFHSFAGVPIIRRERAVGVLAVQHAEAGLHRVAHRTGDGDLVQTAADGADQGAGEALAAVGQRGLADVGVRDGPADTAGDAVGDLVGAQALLETGGGDQHAQSHQGSPRAAVSAVSRGRTGCAAAVHRACVAGMRPG